MQVELLKPHMHAGIAYPPLTVVAMEADLAQWLIDTGVARVVVINDLATPSTKPAPVEHNPKPFSRNEEKSK